MLLFLVLFATWLFPFVFILILRMHSGFRRYWDQIDNGTVLIFLIPIINWIGAVVVTYHCFKYINLLAIAYSSKFKTDITSILEQS